MKHFSLLVASAVAASFAMPALCAAPAPATAITREISPPAAADSQCPNLAAAPDGTLHLTWCAPSATTRGARALFVSSLPPTATTWSAPRTIVSAPELMESASDFPTLCVGTDGALTAQWFIRHGPSRHDYDGWFARSTDGGATWTKPASLGNEFVALAPLSGGRTLAVWLARVGPAHDSHSAHGAPPAARDPRAPAAPTMKLLARLLAPDGSSLGEWTVDPDVCTCCQNTVATLPGDRVFVGYRGHNSDDIRDNKYAFFELATRAFTAPVTLRDDGWKIAACPVNGPAADALGDALAVSWFTAADGVARVFARRSADAGHTFTTPVAVDLGRPMGRLETVLLVDRSALILWMEMKTEANAAGIYARRLFPDGTLSAPQLVTDSSQSRASGFPRAALRPNGRVVMAWTHTAEISQVRTLEIDPTSFVSAPKKITAAPPISGARVSLDFCIAPITASHQISSQ